MDKYILRIKDEKDLNELMKYGFIKSISISNSSIYYKYYSINHYEDDQSWLEVCSDNRLLTFNYKMKHGGQSFTWHLVPIFDLIRDGFIEKVEIQ